jgi:hypothetical protein
VFLNGLTAIDRLSTGDCRGGAPDRVMPVVVVVIVVAVFCGGLSIVRRGVCNCGAAIFVEVVVVFDVAGPKVAPDDLVIIVGAALDCVLRVTVTFVGGMRLGSLLGVVVGVAVEIDVVGPCVGGPPASRSRGFCAVWLSDPPASSAVRPPLGRVAAGIPGIRDGPPPNLIDAIVQVSVGMEDRAS